MPFTRPNELPYPHVWHRFEVNKPGAGILKLRVQDLTEDLYEECIQLLLKHFTADEPPCKHMEIHKYPSALKELENLWRSTITARLSLVCVEDNDEEKVVGLNVLTVACKDDDDEPFHSEDKIWASLFGAVDLVARSVDVFSHFGVDKYLTAYGLVVAPQYRGLSIGKEILKARIPLCKALNIRVTATVFTAAASQIVASRAGFITLFEITYEELAKHGYVFPGVEKSTKYSKLMALVIE